MAFNIQEFRQNIADHGYIDNNNFEVIVTTPDVLNNAAFNNRASPINTNQFSKKMAMRIDQVRMPGINLQTTQVSRYGIGPIQNMPINAQFQEVNFSILIDEFGEFWQYWYTWVNSIFGFNGTTRTLPTYQTEYKNKYSTVVSLLMYNHLGAVVQTINLYEAFPTSIREVPMSWGDNQLIRLNIQLAYTSYSLETNAIKHNPPTPNRNLNGTLVNAR